MGSRQDVDRTAVYQSHNLIYGLES